MSAVHSTRRPSSASAASTRRPAANEPPVAVNGKGSACPPLAPSASPGDDAPTPPAAATTTPHAPAAGATGGTRVQVGVRIRPVNRADVADDRVVVGRTEHGIIAVDTELAALPPSAVRPSTFSSTAGIRPYTFDHVFEGDQQAPIFAAFGRPMVAELFSGFNVCLFAYGQTGSGKTHTMLGKHHGHGGGPTAVGGASGEVGEVTHPPSALERLASAVGRRGPEPPVDRDAGIVPRVVYEIFDKAQRCVETNEDLTVKITLSFLEIYLERIRDLLAAPSAAATRQLQRYRRPTSASSGVSSAASIATSTTAASALQAVQSAGMDQGLEIHETSSKKVYVKDLSVYAVLTAERALELIQRGMAARQMAETRMNEYSSRSHTVIQLTVTQVFDGPERRDLESVISLVDLAGSERQGKTDATGLHFEESKNINKSLLMLGRALNSFSGERPGEFLSLRESKLTRLLSDCFGGNSKTWMLATVSPAACHMSESLSTLEYATNAKKITNRATINKLLRQYEWEELDKGIKQLEELLIAQRAIIAEHRCRIEALEKENGTLKQQLSDDRVADLTSELTRLVLEHDELRRQAAELDAELGDWPLDGVGNRFGRPLSPRSTNSLSLRNHPPANASSTAMCSSGASRKGDEEKGVAAWSLRFIGRAAFSLKKVLGDGHKFVTAPVAGLSPSAAPEAVSAVQLPVLLRVRLHSERQQEVRGRESEETSLEDEGIALSLEVLDVAGMPETCAAVALQIWFEGQEATALSVSAKPCIRGTAQLHFKKLYLLQPVSPQLVDWLSRPTALTVEVRGFW